MKVSDVLEALKEFPPSMRLIVKSRGEARMETTVVETFSKLTSRQPDGLISFCGDSSFILREHHPEPQPNAPPQLSWLTMDWR